MSAHQIRCGDIRCTCCRKNKDPKKASDTCSSLWLPDTRKHRVSPVWSGLIQSHAGPPCSGGQGHPSATSTCQQRLAGEGLWGDAGDRLKGDTNRDLECQSAERRGILHFKNAGGWEVIDVTCTQIKRAHTRAGTNSHVFTKEADVQTNAFLLHLRRVISFEPFLSLTSKPVTSPNNHESRRTESQSTADTNFAILALMCCSLKALQQAISPGACMCCLGCEALNTRLKSLGWKN